MRIIQYSSALLAAITLFTSTACARLGAEDEPVAKAVFQPERLLWYDGTPVGEPLNISRVKAVAAVEASSTLAPEIRYGVANLTDDDRSTAWCEGAAGPGTFEVIKIAFKETHVPAAMMIVPGYAKNPAVWRNNLRVKMVRVQFLKSAEAKSEDPHEAYFVGELISGRSAFPKKQYFDFRPMFTQDMTAGDYEGLEVKITAVDSEGAKAQDTCISEIRFYEW